MAKQNKSKQQEQPKEKDIDQPIAPLNETGAFLAANERWKEAQQAEKAAHEADPNNNAAHYAETYKIYMKYVGLGTDLHGLHVIEIGPGHYPALQICTNYDQSMIIEPMFSKSVNDFVHGKDIILEPIGLEHINPEYLAAMLTGMPGTKEVWLFNVLQHVIDPDLFVKRCKYMADRIRFFEPINVPTSAHHPHTFTGDDYINWFGVETKFYKGGTEPGFHTADCAYGVWIK